jgi:hypothetical protein
MLAVGVGIALAIPVVAAGAAKVVAAQTVRRTIEQLPSGQRDLTVTGQQWVYRSGHSAAEVDALIDGSLRELSGNPIRRQLVFRQLSIAGSTFFLSATDDLHSAVQLISGRWPASCTPARCEVLFVGAQDPDATAKAASSLGVVVVGAASRSDPTLVSGTFDTGSTALLVGDGVDRMAQLDALTLFQRTYGWVTQIDTRRVLALGARTYVQRAGAVADGLSTTLLGVGLEPPAAALAAEDQRVALSARRFELLGGTAATLLLGFAVVAAVSLRREHALLVRVLRIRGARLARVTALTLWMVTAVVVAGSLLGVGLGSALVAELAHVAGVSIDTTILHAVINAGPELAALAIGWVGVATAVLLWPDARQSAAWSAVNLAALGCFAAAVLAISRGTTTVAGLASHADPLLIALPALASLTAGLVSARLWVPVTTLSDRAIPGRSTARRIALLSSVRRPLRPVATAGFLTAAVTSVVFAGAYRATLFEGAADQAATAVPLDMSISAGPSLAAPLAVTSGARIDAIAPGVRTFGTIRDSAVVRSADGSASGVPMLGVDVASLPYVQRWSRTTGSAVSASALASDLSTPKPPTGPIVAAGRSPISIEATGLSPDIKLVIWFANADGREGAAQLTAHPGNLVGSLPDLGGELRAIALTMAEDPDYATRHQHAIGEGNTDQPLLAGRMSLGAVQIGGTPVTWDWSSWTADTAGTSVRGGTLTVEFRLTGSLLVLAPAAPTTIPVAVDPATAASAVHGTLALKVGDTTVSGHIVAELPRFPTVSGPFVLADRAALRSLLDRGRPGTGAPSELWVTAPAAVRPDLLRSFAAPTYGPLDVRSRSAIEAGLRSDPVAQGSRLLLAFVAGIALLVAATSLVVFVGGERRDDASELYAWEADGIAPSTLRGVLLIRAVAVIAVAVPLGLVAGLILVRVGVTLIAVDASGVVPRPPLQVAIGSAWTAVVLITAIGFAVLLVAAVASRALREPLPIRPEVDLR